MCNLKLYMDVKMKEDLVIFFPVHHFYLVCIYIFRPYIPLCLISKSVCIYIGFIQISDHCELYNIKKNDNL